MAVRLRAVVAWSLVAFAASYVLLAPVHCVGYCEDFDETAGRDGRCLSSCTTLLGYDAPLGAGWFLVPVLLVGLGASLRSRSRAGRLAAPEQRTRP